MNRSRQQQSPPNMDEFAQILMDVARRRGMTGNFEYDPDERCLRNSDRGTMFLENAYREYSLAPLGERSRVLRHWIRAWFGMRTELPAEFEDAACDLLPEVKSRAFYHLSALETQLEHGAAPLMSYKLIGEHLGAAIVYDMPHQMLQISQEHLDRWG